ncbi:DUF2752 domain-containing protein [Sporocytophaga myxococcoides]|uniref:DUF2752 domain-containing protein n=1 Tax=Sporocytophaga myxococcoides TaxID=153721 RepID=UPI00048DC9F5
MLFKAFNNFYLKYLLAISVIVGGYLFLYVFDHYNNHQHFTLCIFKRITGIPCPGCGMGRATLELMKGDFAEAFLYNILSIPFSILIIISLIWMFVDLFRQKDTFFVYIQKGMKLQYRILIFVVLVMNWIVNIIRGM